MTERRRGTITFLIPPLMALLAGCGAQSIAPFTPEAPPSVEAELENEANDVAVAFLDRMADPDVTYRVSGEVTIGEGDPPAARVTTAYDVAGDRYGGFVRVRGPALGDAAGSGDFQAIVVDGTTHVYDHFFVMGWFSAESPESARRPNPWTDLTGEDLVFMGKTEDGLFEFDVTPWIGGDPVGEWVDVGALETKGLAPVTVESHRTRLTLDDDAIAHRLTSSFTFVAGPDENAGRGSLVDQYSDMGLYVSISAPEPGGFLGESSHNLLDTGRPFFEVRPPDADTAQVNVAFEEPEQPFLLGMEGAIGFIRSHAPDGTLQLDTIISLQEDVVDVPIGQQTLVVYYRTCDANCSMLDGPHDFCIVDAEIEGGVRFDLTVKVVDRDLAVCELTPTG